MIEIKEAKELSLKEDARIWKKNCETVCDIVALYDILAKTWRGIALKTIVLKIVEDLEDQENYIPYKIENGKVYDLIKMIEAKRKEIEEKYKDDFSEEYLKSLLSVERETDYLDYLYNSDGGIEKHNIIDKLIQENDEKVACFLDSNIDFGIRKEMFKEFLYYTRRNNSISNVLGLEDRKGIIELIKWFDDSAFEKMKFIEYIIDTNSDFKIYDVENYINLYNFNWMYKYVENSENKQVGVSMPAIYASTTGEIPKLIYESTNYQKLDHRIKSNTDIIILRNLNKSSIPNFISLDAFEIDDDKLEIICNITLNMILTINDEKEREELYEKVKNNILRKAKDKKEYRKYLSFYMENVNYKKVLEEDRNKKKKNIALRKDLVRLLGTLNDKLQEEVPGKRLIKEIDFKKED